jgi:hypothetical protein
MTNCPKCGEPLTDEELRALWASYRGSKTSPAKQAAARINGRKGGIKKGGTDGR